MPAIIRERRTGPEADIAFHGVAAEMLKKPGLFVPLAAFVPPAPESPADREWNQCFGGHGILLSQK
jgi:hypothetical protein